MSENSIVGGKVTLEVEKQQTYIHIVVELETTVTDMLRELLDRVNAEFDTNYKLKI